MKTRSRWAFVLFGFVFNFTISVVAENNLSSSETPTVSFELRAATDQVTEGYQLRKDRDDREIFVGNTIILTNSDIEKTEVVADDRNPSQFQIWMDLSVTGRLTFADFTEKQIGKQVAFIIDGTVYSAPIVVHKLTTGTLTLVGFKSQTEAERIARGIIGVDDNN